jgi:hypothetical protein
MWEALCTERQPVKLTAHLLDRITARLSLEI